MCRLNFAYVLLIGACHVAAGLTAGSLRSSTGADVTTPGVVGSVYEGFQAKSDGHVPIVFEPRTPLDFVSTETAAAKSTTGTAGTTVDGDSGRETSLRSPESTATMVPQAFLATEPSSASWGSASFISSSTRILGDSLSPSTFSTAWVPSASFSSPKALNTTLNTTVNTMLKTALDSTLETTLHGTLMKIANTILDKILDTIINKALDNTSNTKRTMTPDDTLSTTLDTTINVTECGPACDIYHWCNNGVCKLRDYHQGTCASTSRGPCGSCSDCRCLPTTETDGDRFNFCAGFPRQPTLAWKANCTELYCNNSGDCPGPAVCMVGVCDSPLAGVCNHPGTNCADLPQMPTLDVIGHM